MTKNIRRGDARGYMPLEINILLTVYSLLLQSLRVDLRKSNVV